MLSAPEFTAKEFHYDIILYSNSHFTPLQIYSLENKIKIFSVDAMPSYLDMIEEFAKRINADLIQYKDKSLQTAHYGCSIFALVYLETMSQIEESEKIHCCSLQAIDPKFLVFTQSLSTLKKLKNTRHNLYDETINEKGESLEKALKIILTKEGDSIHKQNRNIDYKTYDYLSKALEKLKIYYNDAKSLESLVISA